MANDWKKLKETDLGEGYAKFIVKKYLLPNGTEYDFYIRCDFIDVCILALDENKNVILVKQFRPGPEQYLTELPAGIVDVHGESPEQTAKRELLEETGYTGDVELAATAYHGAYAGQKRHVFVAINCRRIQDPRPEDSESIEVVKMSLAEFRKHIKTGEMANTDSAYLALDHLGLL